MKLTSLSELVKEEDGIGGQWRLNADHDLEYWENNEAKQAKFRASLVQAESNALVVAVTANEREDKFITGTARLTGTWQLNDKNQIVFDVEKKSGPTDRLTFQGGWRVNDSHEIVYTYEPSDRKRRTRELQRLTFRGYWDITERNRLTYLLEGDAKSAFRIRGAFQTQSILAKEGQIRYQFGIEAEGTERLETITLFGKWKLSRDFALSFEIEYRGRRKHAIVFVSKFNLGHGRTIETKLMNKEGKSLGLEVIFTQESLESELFLRLRKSLEESAVEAGVKVPW